MEFAAGGDPTKGGGVRAKEVAGGDGIFFGPGLRLAPKSALVPLLFFFRLP